MDLKQAIETFDQEYARSNGFGKAGLLVEQWTAADVQSLMRYCDEAASKRGAQLKGALIGTNVAARLNLKPIIGTGGYFEGIPCFITDEDDRIDFFFGPGDLAAPPLAYAGPRD